MIIGKLCQQSAPSCRAQNLIHKKYTACFVLCFVSCWPTEGMISTSLSSFWSLVLQQVGGFLILSLKHRLYIALSTQFSFINDIQRQKSLKTKEIYLKKKKILLKQKNYILTNVPKLKKCIKT